jgi:dCTP deaminase
VTLSGEAIKQRLCDRDYGLAITPLLGSDQVTEASVDLRLGPDLVVTRRETGVLAFDPARTSDMAAELSDYQTYVRRPLGSAFYLHPGDFAIARSLEYVTLPQTLSAQAIGRSSWGRLGLVIATATTVQPGFQGTITLELANLGRVPLVLYVGVRIAQLALYETPPVTRPRLRLRRGAGRVRL